MADTRFLKEVEKYIRQKLANDFGKPFYEGAQMLPLKFGGIHEFDAVSEDKSIIASIKTSSGKTSGGKHPAGKVAGALAELFYLSEIEAETRVLVLTNKSFHAILMKRLKGRSMDIHPLVLLIELPPEIELKVSAIQQKASQEISKSPQLMDKLTDDGIEVLNYD